MIKTNKKNKKKIKIFLCESPFPLIYNIRVHVHVP